MTWPKRCLIAGSSLLTSMVVLVLADAMSATAQGGPPPGPDVNVINTDASPVPVTAAAPLPVVGSLTLGGTPTVNLSPGSLVDARQAGEWNVDIDRVRCPFNAVRASWRSTAPCKVRSAMALSTSGDGGRRSGGRSPRPVRFDGFNASVVSQQVRLYADPGSDITLRSGRNFTSGDFPTNATISGYLIPLPWPDCCSSDMPGF